jgi:hypothetical protein
MGICSVVVESARAVNATKGHLNASEARQLEVLCRMPAYAQAKDLGGWEREFLLAVGVDEGSQFEVGSLLWAIFEFGRLNLYGAFDFEATQQAFVRLLEELASHGIGGIHETSVSSW